MWSPTITSLLLSLNEKTRTWMTKPYELAAALGRVCQQLQVTIHYQGLASCYDDELQRLGIPSTQNFIREVFLEGDGVPFCFARTVIPLKTYQQYKPQIDALENRLLGHTLLYPQGDAICRSAFEYAAIDRTHPYFLKSAVSTQHSLGARRSVFHIQEHYPLLITEVFLPGIPLYKPEIKAEST